MNNNRDKRSTGRSKEYDQLIGVTLLVVIGGILTAPIWGPIYLGYIACEKIHSQVKSKRDANKTKDTRDIEKQGDKIEYHQNDGSIKKQNITTSTHRTIPRVDSQNVTGMSMFVECRNDSPPCRENEIDLEHPRENVKFK